MGTAIFGLTNESGCAPFHIQDKEVNPKVDSLNAQGTDSFEGGASRTIPYCRYGQRRGKVSSGCAQQPARQHTEVHTPANL